MVRRAYKAAHILSDKQQRSRSHRLSSWICAGSAVVFDLLVSAPSFLPSNTHAHGGAGQDEATSTTTQRSSYADGANRIFSATGRYARWLHLAQLRKTQDS